MNGIQSMTPGIVGRLSSMGIEPLKQLFAKAMSPGGAAMNVPPLAILGAIQNAAKQQQMRQAQMGGMAQMQARAQPATIAQQAIAQADQVEQQPVMAAHGGMMRGYSGGGIVALRNGGAVQRFATGTNEEGLQAEEDISDDPSLSLAERWRRSQKRAELSRQKGIGRSFAERFPAPQESTTDTGDELTRLMQRGRPQPPNPPAIDVPFGRDMAAERRPSGVAALARPTGVPQATQTAAPQMTATPANLPPEYLAAMQAQEERLRGRLNRPESLTRAEEGIAALAKANIEAQQAEAKTYGEEIRAARDAALARAKRGIMDDPMALLALAGSIDTRRGQGVGSLARGAAGLMGEREKQAQAAQKEFTQAQRDERAMQANIRQTQMLEAQRQVALEQGKLGEVNAINDQLSNLAMEREKFRIARGDKAFEQALEGRKVAATERTARASEISASKPSEFDQRVRLFQTNPEQYRTMYGIDPKETSVELRALKDEEQSHLEELKTAITDAQRKPIQEKLQEIRKMRRTLMGAPTAAASAANDPLGLRK